MATTQNTPRHGWMEEVLTQAQATVEQAQPFRDKLNRWYNAGEPAWMAAESLRFCVKEYARQLRIEEMQKMDSVSEAVKACERVLRGNRK